MLIVPVSGKMGWKNPPVVTLALIVINSLIFFLFQTDDNVARIRAEFFYLESGLAEIEVPRYLEFLEAAGMASEDIDPIEDLDEDRLVELHFSMESDVRFLELLAAGQIITPANKRYDEWVLLRHDYEQRRNRNVAFSHGLRPAYPRPLAFVTYMFLHGSRGHLMGNMLFLWVLGCMLEVGCGRLLFTLIYLTSGVMAGGLFCLVYSDSTLPLVGASGAVSGLMGAYTVLYGIRKVTIFYSLGFYFNTATVPAIILLPFWLAVECYQLFFGGVSSVAYVAHIGGMVGGALLAFIGMRLFHVDRNQFEAVVEDKVTPLMDQAVEHMGNLEMEPARELFEEVLALEPDNLAARKHLFNIHKLNPASKAFHTAARDLLRVQLKDAADHPQALATYETYAQLSRRPNLPIALYLQIAAAKVTGGELQGAEKIVLAIMKHKPDLPALPATLIKLSRAFRQQGRLNRWKHYRQMVSKYYPDSPEAALIAQSSGGNPAPSENS